MRITEKGQITIPIQLREKYGFLPHVEVHFVEEKGRVYLKKSATKKTRGKEIIRHLRGSATVRMTTSEIMKLTRGE